MITGANAETFLERLDGDPFVLNFSVRPSRMKTATTSCALASQTRISIRISGRKSTSSFPDAAEFRATLLAA